MMFLWKKRMAEFMSQAYEYNKSHHSFVNEIKDQINYNDLICDAGCGLGYISLALSPYCRQIHAIDLQEKPLKILKDNISKMNIKNILVKQENIHEMTSSVQYDKMIFSFFGSIEEALSIGKKYCSGQIILLKNDARHHSMSIEKKTYKGPSFVKAKKYLEQHQIPYQVKKIKTEMGQPFRSIEDAVYFFNLYNRNLLKEIKEEDVIELLDPIKHPEYVYFYSVKKDIAIITVESYNLNS